MNKFLKLSTYYIYELFHSYTYIVMNLASYLLSIAILLLVYFLRSKNLDSSSFIISISFQIIILIQMLFIIMKLFNENKHNLSDIKLLGKNFFRDQIFWSKYFIVFINAFILEILITVTNSFIMLGLSISGEIIGGLFVSNLLGLLINILFFSAILVICAIFLNRIWSPIISLMIVMVSPITSFINNFILVSKQKCNDINENINCENASVQYGKIYKFNENNELIDFKYVYNYNYTQMLKTNLNTNIPNSINYTNEYNYLIPGNINLSLQSTIYSSINKNVDLNDYLMYDGSLSKIKPSNFENLSSYINNGYSYVLTNMNDENYFNLNENQLKNLIISDLKTIVNEYSSIINNKKELSAILNKLETSEIWNIQAFNNRQFDLICELLGKQKSSLFYTWYYNSYLKGNMGNIINEINYSFNNQELANLLNYLWFNESTYFNLVLINSQFSQMQNFKNFMLDKYPINFMYDSNLMTSINNLNYIKNILVKIQNDDIYILNNNGIYDVVDKQTFLHLFKLTTLNNQNDWINYLTVNNIPTVGFIQDVYNKIKSLKNDVVSINLENNNFDLRSFNQVFDLIKVPFSSGYITTIIMQICLTIFFISLAYYSYLKIRLD